MKNYTITVNGNVYDVTVEETVSTTGAAAPRRTAITSCTGTASVRWQNWPAICAAVPSGAAWLMGRCSRRVPMRR